MGLFDRFKKGNSKGKNSEVKVGAVKNPSNKVRNYELEFKNAYLRQDFDTVSEVITSWRDNVPDAKDDANFLYASTIYMAVLGVATNNDSLKNQVNPTFERAGNAKAKNPEFKDWFVFAALGARDSVKK